MSFRKSNSHWSEKAQKLYFKKFLHEINSKSFRVSEKVFNNTKVLDCLEKETNSSRSISKLIKKIVKKRKINSILIIGSGSGRLTTQIRRLFPRTKLFDVDRNKAVIKRLQRKHKDDPFRFSLLGEAHRLPFEENTIDVVICYGVFRYIKNTKEAINEILRIMSKNGRLIIGEGKDKATIEKVKEELNNIKIIYKTKLIPTIKLPHLTFFYYLISQYGTDEAITTIMNEEIINKKFELEEGAFKLAGYSLGSIYYISLSKNP